MARAEAAVHGSLRGRQGLPPPPLADDEGDLGLDDAEVEPPVHKAFNPTTRKVACPQHADVIVKRHKFRTAAVVVPCWRCIEEAKERAEEDRKAAEARVAFLHSALEEEKERAVVLERRAASLEEEQLGLRGQIAKLVEQVAGLSGELSHVLDINKSLAEQQRNRTILMGQQQQQQQPPPPAATQGRASPPASIPSPRTPAPAGAPPAAAAASSVAPVAAAMAAASTSPPPMVVQAQGGPAGPGPLPLLSGDEGKPAVPPTGLPHHAASAPAPASSSANGSALRGDSAVAAEAMAAINAAASAVSAAAAAVAAKPHPPSSSQHRPSIDLGLGASGGSLPEPPMSPLPQSLGSSGKSRVFRQPSSTEQAKPPQKEEVEKKAGTKWSLFGGGKAKKHKQRQANHGTAAGAEGALPSPSSGTPAATTAVDELDEPLSVDLLAKKLLRMIDSRPDCLEKIYRKSEMLEEWRIEMQLELGVTSCQELEQQQERADSLGGGAAGADDDAAASLGATGASGSGSSGRSSGLMYRMEHSPSCLFEDQMELVGALTNAIKVTVLKHVADCFRLASANPEVLRQALAVVRLHEEFQQRKLASARGKVQQSGERNLDTILRLCALEDWDSEVRLTLKEAAALRALEVFSVAHMEAATGDAGATGVAVGEGAEAGLGREQAMIAAAESVVEDLRAVLREVAPFFAPQHRAAATMVGQYDAHVTRQVAALHEHGLDDLELGDLFEINRFLQAYQKEIVELGAAHPRPELAVAAKACLQECMVKTRQQMTDWYNAILGRASEVMFDGEGRPFTANPEDLFQLIHTQVRVASDAGGFAGDDLCALVVVILTAMKEFVAEHHAKLHAQRALDEPRLGVAQLCATVNDYDRLYDKATELRDELLGRGKLDADRHFDVVDPVLDQLNDEQARVSFEATRLVAYLVLRDATASLLQASPFDSPDGAPLQSSVGAWDGGYLFGNGGGGGGGGAGGAAAALVDKAKKKAGAAAKDKAAMAKVDVLKDARLTIKDYFGDLEVWLPEYFFSHVVRTCFEGLIALYVVSVLRGRTLFDDVQRVHHRMRQDKQAILDDFAPYARQLQEQGLADMLVPFAPWDDLMEVVLKGGEAKAPWTGYLLRTLPPPWNVDAVLQVRALRGEVLDKKARQEARQRLVDWYRAELAAPSPQPPGGQQDKTAAASTAGRRLAWRLQTSPLEGKRDRTLVYVKDCVFNA